MKKKLLNDFFLATFCIAAIYANAATELRENYERVCCESSDIYEHIPVLYQLSKECSSVVEIGLRDMNSSWGILQGLSENPNAPRYYLGVDMCQPPSHIFNNAKNLSLANGIAFHFLEANDMDIDLEPADMLFIDSLHTYCHLMYELEKFSPMIQKYIAMHDTSDPWGTIDDCEYHGDYSEYPLHFDRKKRGLWAAVVDFLAIHPEWRLKERRLNNHGFTTLERISN